MTPRPLVIALPGFTRSPKHLARLAEACNAAGLDCVRPALAPRWMPVLYMERSHLRRLAEHLAGSAAGRPVVVAGHSAGAAAGCALAVDLLELDVALRGVVLIDGVESPTRLIASSLPDLTGVRVAAVLAPPSPCNRQGALGRALEEWPDVRVSLVDGAGHGDIEGPGPAVYRRACGDTSDDATAARFLDAVMDAIAWSADGVAL